jgi:hypothetical protein
MPSKKLYFQALLSGRGNLLTPFFLFDSLYIQLLHIYNGCRAANFCRVACFFTAQTV